MGSNVLLSGITDVGSHWSMGRFQCGRGTRGAMRNLKTVILAQSPLKLVVFGVTALLVAIVAFAPKPQPQGWATLLGVIFALVAIFAGQLPLYPAAWNLSSRKTGLALLFLGILPPIVGPIEAWLWGDPQIFQFDRFPLHFITNVVSVVGATGLLILIRSIDYVREFNLSVDDKTALNCVLPMAVLSAFAYVRWQQGEVPTGSPLTGYSLSHMHQTANFVFLTVIWFTAATTVLYLFAVAIRGRQRQPNDALPYSGRIGGAMVLSVAFFYVCGYAEWSQPHRAMNLTFLTGAPAALAAALVFLSLLQPSPARFWFAIAFASVGYSLYTVEVIFASRGVGPGLSPYYLMPGLFAVVLGLLAIALSHTADTVQPQQDPPL